MTFLSAVAGFLAALMPNGRTTYDDRPIRGAEAVQAAVTEVESIVDRRFEATLGEPDIMDFGGYFQPDWKVIVPVESSDYTNPGPLIFDLPRGRSDGDALLYTLLDHLGLDFDSLAEVEGKTVPMEVVGGNSLVLWDAVRADDADDEELAEAYRSAAERDPEDDIPEVDDE